jgi:Family of unknown function (DUF5329)
MKILLATFATFISFYASAAVSINTKQEITFLFAHLKDSGCKFNRNGSWYKADAAANHLNQKYEYLLKKGYISTTEDFIARAASESSMSHKAYIVKCGGTETKSTAWFKDALTKYRSESETATAKTQ